MSAVGNLPSSGGRGSQALPGHNRVLGVVRAATATAAVAKVEREEKALGRGPLVDGATDVEQVYEQEEN